MTAQIAVFNERCVAIASDSTLTIGTGPRARTVQTADKVFDVGDGHRVVVMISGAASFMDVPYDVLIAEWKRTLVSPLRSLQEYCSSFIAWLGSRSDIFDEAAERQLFGWLVRDMYLAIRSSLIEELQEQALAELPWDDLTVVRLTDGNIDRWCERVAARAPLPDWTPDAVEAVVSRFEGEIRAAFEYVFDDVPRTASSDRRLLADIPRLVVSRAEPWSRDATIAFVGYGADDLFPGHQVVELTGVMGGIPLADYWEPTAISPSMRANLTPFAQDEAIQTFLRAYNRDFLTAAHKALDDAWGSRGDDELPAGEEERRSEAHLALSREFERISHERFISPLLDTVEALPKADMARMAEALVGIQALRSASGEGLPTVGGPIDVVVVSRDGGVEWVRRKRLAV